jgi:hypothetical protein
MECVYQHGNLGTKKLRTHPLQAVVTLCLMLEQPADHMPYKTRTLESKKRLHPNDFHCLAVEGLFVRTQYREFLTGLEDNAPHKTQYNLQQILIKILYKETR